MASGRKAKPTTLKLIDGNPGKRPINKKEPKCNTIARRPTWISRMAKAVWREYGPEMEKMGLLSKVDEPLFAAFCTAVAEFRWCEEYLKENGRLIETPKGFLQTSPVVSQRKQALELVRQFGSEFGLSPSSRSKIITPDSKLPTIGNVFGPKVVPEVSNG